MYFNYESYEKKKKKVYIFGLSVILQAQPLKERN